MKKLITLLVCCTAFPAVSFADIRGTWRTQEGESGGYALVLIDFCSDDGDLYCGEIIDLLDTDDTSSLGSAIIVDMEDRGNGRYRGGKIYAPDQDRWYNSRMKLEGDVLEVYGCVAGGLICRGQDWTRAE